MPPCDTLLFSADFVFSNITKDGTEESVARLGLTCVQDWDETGAQEKMHKLCFYFPTQEHLWDPISSVPKLPVLRQKTRQTRFCVLNFPSKWNFHCPWRCQTSLNQEMNSLNLIWKHFQCYNMKVTFPSKKLEHWQDMHCMYGQACQAGSGKVVI